MNKDDSYQWWIHINNSLKLLTIHLNFFKPINLNHDVILTKSQQSKFCVLQVYTNST